MPEIVYYSSETGNTLAFIKKLGFLNCSIRIPKKLEVPIILEKDYILFIPTYASNDGRGSLPKSVVKFLNIENNRTMLKGIIASGNTNFGKNYCLGGDIIANKCNKPVLYRYELRGTEDDVINVKEILKNA